jgi:hypothetical protein
MVKGIKTDILFDILIYLGIVALFICVCSNLACTSHSTKGRLIILDQTLYTQQLNHVGNTTYITITFYNDYKLDAGCHYVITL